MNSFLTKIFSNHLILILYSMFVILIPLGCNSSKQEENVAAQKKALIDSVRKSVIDSISFQMRKDSLEKAKIMESQRRSSDLLVVNDQINQLEAELNVQEAMLQDDHSFKPFRSSVKKEQDLRMRALQIGKIKNVLLELNEIKRSIKGELKYRMLSQEEITRKLYVD